jgi:uncharacterized protein (DUF1800 family)
MLLLPLAAAALVASVPAQSGSPSIQVLNGTTVIPQNGSVSYGSTGVGVPSSITFTVQNTGTANLLVSEAISVPLGFTLMTNFPGVPDSSLGTNVPAFTIAPNASATFTVALNSATAGNFSGPVSFQTNVAGQNPFVFNVSGTVGSPPTVRIVDDSDAGFTASSGWVPNYTQVGASGRTPFQGTLTYANPTATPGTATETAQWTVTGLQPGTYRVSASWVGYNWGATNTPYTICDGSTPLGTVQVDQTVDSNGLVDGGGVWQSLGNYTITGTTLTVKITNDANSYPNADAIRVEVPTAAAQIVDDSSASGFSTTGTWNPGYSEPGHQDYQGSITWANPTTTPGTATATARWTFTVTPGTYRVSASASGYGWAATNAPYSVFDGTTNLTPTPVRINQAVVPTDLVDAGVNWKDLGFFTVTGTTLSVQLTNDANSYPSADAIRIEGANSTGPSLADTVRFLEQASWGPTPALITQVQSSGFNNWLTQQFSAAETSYPTLPLYNTNNNVTNNVTTSCYGDPTVSGNPARTACLRDHYSMYPLQNTFFTNALYGNDQLRQRMAWTLHKIWVISGVEIPQSAWIAPYLQILSANSFGNYRTLMYQVTLNPGMGNYLNMAGSTRATPNENYPREIMQLFAFGLFELNPNGSQKMDGNGQPIPTYDQNLVNNMTRVFTGWNFAPAPSSGVPNYIDPMRLNGAATENPVNHDFTSKTLLRGFVQPARSSSVANAYLDLNEGLDNIYNHPSLAPFLCKQFIQSLVTSNPSQGYVARVVDTFNRNRAAPNQLQLVLRAILLDPEARGDLKTASNYGHLREPVLWVNNLMRMYGAGSDDLTQNSDGYLNPFTVNFGQDVFRPPSVFSYYSPGRVVVSGNPPVLGPEFQIFNTSTTLARVNFVNTSFTPNSTRAIDVVRAHGTTPTGTDPATGQPLVPTGPLGTAVDVSFLVPYANNAGSLVDQLNGLMMHGSMSSDMRSNIVTAVNAVTLSNPATTNQLRKRVHTAIYLVASSSQYQVQQ